MGIAFFFPALVICLVLISFSLSFSVEVEPEEALDAEEAPSWIDPDPIPYDSHVKPDPFEPFIRTEPERTEEERDREHLSPIERVEPGQLDLVGILSSGAPGEAPRALVELPGGKGFVLEEGMTIGMDGSRVVSIRDNGVVIEERYIDVMGEEQTRETVLELPD